jgi:hypothetical protein
MASAYGSGPWLSPPRGGWRRFRPPKQQRSSPVALDRRELTRRDAVPRAASPSSSRLNRWSELLASLSSCLCPPLTLTPCLLLCVLALTAPQRFRARLCEPRRCDRPLDERPLQQPGPLKSLCLLIIPPRFILSCESLKPVCSNVLLFW